MLIFISLKENNGKQGKIIVGFLFLLVGISICSLACFLLCISLTCILIDFIPITFPKTLQTRVTFYILITCFFPNLSQLLGQLTRSNFNPTRYPSQRSDHYLYGCWFQHFKSNKKILWSHLINPWPIQLILLFDWCRHFKYY